MGLIQYLAEGAGPFEPTEREVRTAGGQPVLAERIAVAAVLLLLLLVLVLYINVCKVACILS